MADKAFDDIKMEFGSDDEDSFIYNLCEAAKDIILDKDEDPLLSLTPIVYTTKLDEMKTVKQDLTNLNASEILKKLHSESKPTTTTEPRKRSSHPENMKSFFKLAEVLSRINVKAEPRLPLNAEVLPYKGSPPEFENEDEKSLNNAPPPKSPNANMLPNPSFSDEVNKVERKLSSENVESFCEIVIVASELNPEISTDTVIAPNSYNTSKINIGDNLDDNKECRPCCVVLEDIKYFMLPNQVTVKLPLKSNTPKTIGVDSHNSIEADVEIKQEENQTSDVENYVEIADSFEIQSSEKQNITKTEITVSESSDPVPIIETYTFLKESQKHNSETDKILVKNLETRNESAKTTYSGRPKRKKKPRIRYESDPNEDFEPDEEDFPDQDYVPKDDLPISNTKKQSKNYYAQPELNVSKTGRNVTKTGPKVLTAGQNVSKTGQSSDPVPTKETYTFLKESQKHNSETDKIPVKNLETRNESAKTTYSGRPKRKKKPRIRYESDPDEDYVPNEDFEPDEEDFPDKDYVPGDDLPISNTKKQSKNYYAQPELNVSKTGRNVTKTVSKVLTAGQNVTKTAQNISKTGQNTNKGQDVSKTRQIVSNAASGSMITNEFLACFQEKFCLIVLINKNKTAYLYRVNCTKLVTDFYVAEDCDEYKIAAMFPKEDKVIEDYCCWYKREQIIARICNRKSYSYTIQKFLKEPHTCYDKCHCCCFIMTNDSSQSQQTQRLSVVNRSRPAADSWIRELLNKTNSTTPGLVDKALNYIPTPIIEKPVKKQSDKYLEYYLLCLKNCRSKTLEYEVYEIGKNGDILRSLLLNDEDEVERVRKTYQLKLMPIYDVELCCWFKRETLMHELKMLTTSPATLKFILKPHSCNYQQCLCCCKPALVTLLATEILPSTFKQTTANEIKNCPLTITYKAKSMKATAIKKRYFKKSKIITRSSTTSTAAVELSRCASQDDTPLPSISLMDKIKNLRLGINSSGEMETVLTVPAKNLSVPTLKILSDILAISAKQMVELNLSAEEFCNKINSKSEDRGVIRETGHNTSLISTEILVPPSPPDYDDDNGIVEMDFEDDIPIAMLPNKSVITGGTDIIKSQSKLNEPSKKVIPGSILTPKAISSTFLMISNLMRKKSENYVDSFKAFFNKSDPSKITHKPVDAYEDSSINEVPLMPIIKETFTLAKSGTEGSDIAIPGPSGVTQQLGGNISTVQDDSMEIHSNHQTPSPTERPIKTYKRKTANVTNGQVKKKIRVKNASELNAQILQEPSNSSIISTWPVPIVLKQDPTSNIQQIVRPAQSVKTMSSNQTYIIANNVTMASNIKILNPTSTVNKILHINGNPIQVAANSATNAKNVRYFTIAPSQGQTYDPSKKMMVAKMLNPPQTPPVASNDTKEPPPLVPFGAGRVVSSSDKKKTSDQTKIQKTNSLYK